MICQSCQEAVARFESGQGVLRLKVCLRCLVKSGLHHCGGWRFLTEEGDERLSCPNCRLRFDAFALHARYGCPDCRDTFHSRLEQVFLMPGATLVDPAMEEIELSLALLLEDYELAARIRDQRAAKSKTIEALSGKEHVPDC
jgi:protein-arginine kinase activator protein McsA